MYQGRLAPLRGNGSHLYRGAVLNSFLDHAYGSYLCVLACAFHGHGYGKNPMLLSSDLHHLILIFGFAWPGRTVPARTGGASCGECVAGVWLLQGI